MRLVVRIATRPGRTHSPCRKEWSRCKAPAGVIARSRRRPRLHASEYVDGVLSGDRAILARAITVIESSRSDDTELAQEFWKHCLPHTGKSVRVGITGVPGAGKSTFIDALGHVPHARARREGRGAGRRSQSASSRAARILGDKTRMERLSSDEKAFIRPSPSSGSLGGVARRTRETMLLCEAAGYRNMIVETVGVGQSETTVRSMVDFFLLLMLAGAGDELQGIKRGIMEMTDLIAINKADGDNQDRRPSARQSRIRQRAASVSRPARRAGRRAW